MNLKLQILVRVISMFPKHVSIHKKTNGKSIKIVFYCHVNLENICWDKIHHSSDQNILLTVHKPVLWMFHPKIIPFNDHNSLNYNGSLIFIYALNYCGPQILKKNQYAVFFLICTTILLIIANLRTYLNWLHA